MYATSDAGGREGRDGNEVGAGANVDGVGSGGTDKGREEESTLLLNTGINSRTVPADANAPTSTTVGRLGGGGEETSKKQARMAITFTCTVCDERSTKTFTKHSYTKGVVLIKCPGCQNLHLIADNLGWFAQDGAKINIEDMMFVFSCCSLR